MGHSSFSAIRLKIRFFHCCWRKRGQFYLSPCQLFKDFFPPISFFKFQIHYNPASTRRSLSSFVITFNYWVAVACVRSGERSVRATASEQKLLCALLARMIESLGDYRWWMSLQASALLHYFLSLFFLYSLMIYNALSCPILVAAWWMS